MADDPSVIPYRPPGKPRAIIESGQAVQNFSIRPPTVWRGVAAWGFAAAMFLLMFFSTTDAARLRINFSGIVFGVLLCATLIYVLRLIIRRRRVPTLISVGNGFLIILTPDLPKMHHEFEISARLRIQFGGDVGIFSVQSNMLQVIDSGHVALVFAHRGNAAELLRIANAVNQAIWAHLQPPDSPELAAGLPPTAAADPLPL